MLKKKGSAVGLQFVVGTHLGFVFACLSGSVIIYTQVASKMKYATLKSSLVLGGRSRNVIGLDKTTQHLLHRDMSWE